MREEGGPPSMLRQDAGMQHVRVGEDDARVVSDARFVARRSVPIIDTGRKRGAQFEGFRQPFELSELILGKRLCWVEVEGARTRVLKKAVEDRQVVAEGLAAGSR